MFAPLEHWHEFYVLLGTGAAALVALQFVAASLGAGFLSFETAAASRIYMTPVIVHFSSVLFACAAGLIPWHHATTFALTLGVAAAIGTAYSAHLAVRVFRDSGGDIEFDDKLCHGVLPPIGYAVALTSAVMFYLDSPYAAATLAVALLLLLGVNIRNAWDLTLFMARKHTAAKQSSAP
jgi:hypothetical protein